LNPSFFNLLPRKRDGCEAPGKSAALLAGVWLGIEYAQLNFEEIEVLVSLV
jgi:hypothetical protein